MERKVDAFIIKAAREMIVPALAAMYYRTLILFCKYPLLLSRFS
jgi:hypothetical protein